VPSSRRVKKGPGRPRSARRQRFMEPRERGWGKTAAAREVGVSRTTAHSWTSGYKTYRHGQVVGFVPALERLTVRQISSRFAGRTDRDRRFTTSRSGCASDSGPARAVTGDDLMGVAPQHGRQPGLSAFEAHRLASDRRARRHRRPHREARQAAGSDRRVAGAEVEPAVDQPPPAP
jgi:transposase, IS30 family